MRGDDGEAIASLERAAVDCASTGRVRPIAREPNRSVEWRYPSA
jgi:hypothetical protein